MKTTLTALALIATIGATATYANSHAESASDAGDAEKTRVISDTSIAIYSQNPYIQSVMEDTTHIQAARLKEIMDRGDEIILLDVRPRAEFESTPGIEGTAMNIPRNFIEVEAYEQLEDKDASIIIVSSKGIRGGLAAHTLQAMGYTNVRNLLGGVEGWTK
ncbi:rhodanese-like domain-containing protein [Leucothrix arctica]|nr:rhodanese-like domain-containing protein [Leucothrix arctica]